MKEMVLIGAGGFVGSAILREALSRDVPVKAVVRDRGRLKTEHPGLRAVEADVSDATVVADLCRGAEYVVSAYNPGWNNPGIYEETLRVYHRILEGVKQAGVKRLLVAGGAGTLFVRPGVRLMDAGTIPDDLLPGIRALGEFFLDTLSRERGIDWVFLSPAENMVPGMRTGLYRTGKDELLTDAKGCSNISVEDFAKAMIDELLEPKHHRERFTVAY